MTDETIPKSIADAIRDHYQTLVEALEWYALEYDSVLGVSQWDGGARARAALAQIKNLGG